MIRKLFLLIMMCFIVANAIAAEIKVQSEINHKQIILGESARLTVTIEGSQSVDPPQVSSMDGLDIRYLGPSTQVSIVNGQYSSSVAHTYSVFPMKVGNYKIPAFNLSVDGKAFSTDPIDVEVVAAQQNSASSGSQSVTDLKDKMSVVLKPSKTEVYVGEPLPVNIFLLVASDVTVGDVQLPKLSADGFDAGEFKYKQYQTVINGTRFSVVEFETVVYPLREGQLSMGPAQMSFNLIVDISEGDDSYQRGLFNDPFFGSFFGRRESRPMVLQSDVVKLNVKSLPQEGRPADFSGAVGKFDFDVTVGPQEVQVGDPLTVQMKVQGSGSLVEMELPALKDSADFKVYDPSKKSSSGTRSLEQVIIPLSEKVKELPAFTFSYFDPSDGKYYTIRKGPFPLTVKPASQRTQAYTTAVSALQAVIPQIQSEMIGEDIVFIKSDPGDLKPLGAKLYTSKVFYAIVVGYAVIWLAAILSLCFFRRLKTDQVFAEELKAAESARKMLARLKEKTDRPIEFYDGAHQLLIEYFSSKLHIPPGDVSAETVTAHPRWKKVPEDVTRLMSGIFSECESVRFAMMDVSADQTRVTFKNLEAVIRGAEKVIR